MKIKNLTEEDTNYNLLDGFMGFDVTYKRLNIEWKRYRGFLLLDFPGSDTSIVTAVALEETGQLLGYFLTNPHFDGGEDSREYVAMKYTPEYPVVEAFNFEDILDWMKG